MKTKTPQKTPRKTPRKTPSNIDLATEHLGMLDLIHVKFADQLTDLIDDDLDDLYIRLVDKDCTPVDNLSEDMALILPDGELLTGLCILDEEDVPIAFHPAGKVQAAGWLWLTVGSTRKVSTIGEA